MSNARSAVVLPVAAVGDDVSPALRFEALFDAHYDMVWRALRRLGVSDAQADDAAQRVFLVAARRLDELAVGRESRFLYGVALRVASEIRRRDPARREIPGDDALAALPDDAPGPEQLLLDDEAREALDEALAGMPDDLREILVLMEIEGVAAADVAAMLGIPLGTASSRLRRAREAFGKSARRVRARLASGGPR